MKEYELLYIVTPNLAEEELKTLTDKVQHWITSTGGTIDLYEEPGLKELATDIEKMSTGYYVQIQFTAAQPTLDELHERFAVTEAVLRQMVVTMDSIRPKNPPKERAPRAPQQEAVAR